MLILTFSLIFIGYKKICDGGIYNSVKCISFFLLIVKKSLILAGKINLLVTNQH